MTLAVRAIAILKTASSWTDHPGGWNSAAERQSNLSQWLVELFSLGKSYNLSGPVFWSKMRN